MGGGWRATGGAVLLGLVVTMVTGELLARALDIIDRLNGYTRLLYMRGPGADLPYLLRPGVRTTLFDTPVRVDGLGLRGPEASPTPAPGVHRVLALGDSVVFGVGVSEGESVGAVLAERLNAVGHGSWEVLNAGVPGYDAVAEARFLEVRGLALRPEIVVVGTSLNDYDPAPAYSPLGILTRRSLEDRGMGLADRSEFVTLLRWLAGWMRGGLGGQLYAHGIGTVGGAGGDGALIHGLDRMVADQHRRFFQDPVPAYWDRLRSAFADVGRLARTHGLGLLIAIFPEGHQMGTTEPDLTPQRRLLEVCREAEVRCLDLQPAFAAAGGALFQDTQHPSARGHAVAAAAIADALTERAAVAAP